MKNAVRFGVCAYIFFVSWSGVFALNEWVKLPFIFLIVAIIVYCLDLLLIRKVKVQIFCKIDLLLFAFFITYMLSAVINQNELTSNYLLAYFYVFFVLYVLLKVILYTYVTPRQIYIANAWGIFFVGFFLSSNFILSSFGIVKLQDLIPRLQGSSALYAGIFNRGYGFSTEPGDVAYYLNTLGPLAVWFLWRETTFSKFSKLILTSFLLLGWLVTFSAAGVGLLLASLLATLLLLGLSIRKCFMKFITLVKVGILFFTFAGVVVWVSLQPLAQEFISPIYMKLTLSDDMRSSEHRMERWTEGARMVLDKPILGYGPRYFSAQGQISPLNWYLMILVEGGFLSFFFIMFFLLFTMLKIVRFQHPSRIPILIGFLAGSGHLFVISTFQQPFLWLLIAVFFVLKTYFPAHIFSNANFVKSNN